MPRLLFAVVASAILAYPLQAQLDEGFDGAPEHPAIHYQTGPSNDRVAALMGRIDRGELTLASEGPQGYLRSILKALDIPVESQMVVFSRTSVQRQRIHPANPRVLFFNDSVVVGWVSGGFIE